LELALKQQQRFNDWWPSDLRPLSKLRRPELLKESKKFDYCEEALDRTLDQLKHTTPKKPVKAETESAETRVATDANSTKIELPISNDEKIMMQKLLHWHIFRHMHSKADSCRFSLPKPLLWQHDISLLHRVFSPHLYAYATGAAFTQNKKDLLSYEGLTKAANADNAKKFFARVFLKSHTEIYEFLRSLGVKSPVEFASHYLGDPGLDCTKGARPVAFQLTSLKISFGFHTNGDEPCCYINKPTQAGALGQRISVYIHPAFKHLEGSTKKRVVERPNGHLAYRLLGIRGDKLIAEDTKSKAGVRLVHSAKCIWQGFPESEDDWTEVEHLRKQGGQPAQIVESYLRQAPPCKQIDNFLRPYYAPENPDESDKVMPGVKTYSMGRPLSDHLRMIALSVSGTTARLLG
jgi:hypothetical protein